MSSSKRIKSKLILGAISILLFGCNGSHSSENTSSIFSSSFEDSSSFHSDNNSTSNQSSNSSDSSFSEYVSKIDKNKFTFQDVSFISEETRNSLAEFTDLYTCNIFIPNANKENYPLILTTSSSNDEVTSLINNFKDENVIVSLDLKRMNKSFSETISEIQACIRFLKANATTYKINSDIFVLFGSTMDSLLLNSVGTLRNSSMSNYEIEYVNPFNDYENYSSSVELCISNQGIYNFNSLDPLDLSTYAFCSNTDYNLLNCNLYLDNLNSYISPEFMIFNDTGEEEMFKNQRENYLEELVSKISDTKITCQSYATNKNEGIFNESNVKLIQEKINSFKESSDIEWGPLGRKD